MNWLENSNQILTILALCVWVIGFIFLVLGRRARDLDWLSLSTLGLFVVILSVDLFFMSQDQGTPQRLWARGWIGPRDEPGAITIGIIQDFLGLTSAIFSAVLGMFLLSNRWLTEREENGQRVHAGALMGVAGIMVAWLSLTPWLAILGLALSGFGALVMLGATKDSELIAQFGRERTQSFVLIFLGAAVLAGGRTSLAMDRNFVLSASPLPQEFDLIGGVLLLLGLFLQLQPLPFLGWLTRPPRVSSAASAIVAQVFCATAAFSILVRFEAELKSLGIFPAFQWIAVGSAIFAAICGLAQESWKTALPLWLSSMLSFSFAAYCACGSASAFSILLGVLISGSGVSLLASAAEARIFGSQGMSWLRPLLVLVVAPGLGFIGFVSGGGFVRVMTQLAQDPVSAAIFVLAIFVSQLVLWKSLFSILSVPPTTAEPQSSRWAVPISLTGLLVLLSLGLTWTGTLSGGVIPHDSDRVFPSWLTTLFGREYVDVGDDSVAALGQGTFWTTLVVSGLVSFWLFGRGQDLVIRFLSASSGLRRFLQGGYGFERIWAAVTRALTATGEFLDRWLTERISTIWVPQAVQKLLTTPARWIDVADKKVYARGGSILRQWVEVPAKTLQLVQNGDLQWYLVFAIGCVAAILIHFLWI